jgi:hypothetical protein
VRVIPNRNEAGAWQQAVICDAVGNPLDQGCGAALLVESVDVFVRPLTAAPKTSGAFGQSPPNPRFSFNVQCPCCGAWTQLPEERVRPDVRWEAQKRNAPVPQQNFCRAGG